MERRDSTKRKEEGILCTYCVQTPVAATKTCIHCEASMCEEHLKTHSKSAEHVMVEPTTSIKDMKCPIHDKMIEFCCTKDGACICVSCCIIGDHRGHKVDPLKDALEKRKASLKDILDNLTLEGEENEHKLEKLLKNRGSVQEAASGVNERVTALFRDIKEQLEALQTRATSEVSRQEQQATFRMNDLIQQHETKKDELHKKIESIKELHSVTDPLTVLRGTPHEGIKRMSSRKVSDSEANLAASIDENPISLILHMGLQSFAGSVLELKTIRQFSSLKKTDLSLDINTAHSKIILSGDLKSASYSAASQKYPETPERFKSCQVLSTNIFTSGQHYWEVDVSQASRWILGVACNSIERKIPGNESFIGYNNKSWTMFYQKFLGVSHNNVQSTISTDTAVKSVGIHLDYDSGYISFYQVNPTRHLHTYTTCFTKPLHAAFYIFENCSLQIMD
ncbi:PREDICTED: probable E3 ubiquitin-protein ligase MID2 [Nanorana parkeri]|uniref:probable E3 ubiquitin-protein ligase MID2 n=1 Tax=Nanorana parkeri TaxID=125878 RepID=UPI000854F9A2|nr:PREDICTED: probable E3 ubiquitin-protein ligase MID2 [Nanorana parkeri]